MKILIACADFSKRAGMQIYLNRIASYINELGYEVVLVSSEIGLNNDFPCYRFDDKEWRDFCPDVILLNEPQSEQVLSVHYDVPAYQIIHSAREDDAPIISPQVRKYIYSRKQIKDWLIKQGIPKSKLRLIRLPVDSNIFNIDKNKKDCYFDIIAPCTIDELRKPMLLKLIEISNKENKKVLIIGDDYGSLKGINIGENVVIKDKACLNIENYIANSKTVASIYEGLVAIEGLFMGKEIMIFDEKGNYKTTKKPENGQLWRHETKKVVNEFYRMFQEKWADIIIPTHNRTDLLENCLGSIPRLNFNIIVKKGGTFAQNCNRGAKEAITNKLLFINDDTISNKKSIWELLDLLDNNDLVGVRQTYLDGKDLCLGITLKYNKELKKIQYWLTNSRDEVLYPSGGYFGIKKSLFNKVGCFNEEYKNGGEDQDLMLNCIERNAKIDFVETPIIHFLSQSEGRFDYVEECDKIFWNKWTNKRLSKLFDFPSRWELNEINI